VAHHKDAIKRIKQNTKRRARNRHFRTRMRNQIARVRNAVEAGNGEEATAQLRNAISIIHHVVSKGIIHRNQAARKISRLNKAVKAIV
jgi:small subunit ribosomal protein S20